MCMSVYLVGVVLLGGLSSAQLVVPTSPCTGIFNYEMIDGIYVGKISLPSAGPGDRVVRVGLSLKAKLFTPYKGEIEFHETSGNFSKFTLLFPLQNPLPKVWSISQEGRLYCTGEKEKIDRAEQTVYNYKLVKKFTNVLPSDEECGVPRIPIPKNFIVGVTSAGEWPWLVALFLKTDRQYICSGSLVSRNVVITAANCLYVKSLRPASAFFVELGVHDRIANENSNVQIQELREIELTPGHGGYKANTVEDIAALVLASPVAYTDFIQPICLWSGNKDLDEIVGNRGNVVGWGRDEGGDTATLEPIHSEILILSNDQCSESVGPFTRNIDDNSQICAGILSPKMCPCAGDAGAGLTLFRNGHYELRGVASYSFKPQTRASDLSNFIVFCDAAKFSSWVQLVITMHRK